MSAAFPVSTESIQALHFPPSCVHSLLSGLIQTQAVCSPQRMMITAPGTWDKDLLQLFHPKILYACLLQVAE